MIPLARREAILDKLNKMSFVSIASLATELKVSQMTIRRDVSKLEEEGLVIQVSGGVRTTKRLHNEPSHDEKYLLCSEEKISIGKLAAKMVAHNSCIYLDAGTTSLAMSNYLCERDDLTIITNDLVVAHNIASNSNNTIIMVGGLIRARNLSTVGHLTLNTLEGLSIDVAFLSASSFDIRGITTPDPDKVIVKQKVASMATKRILICDSSKYGQVATYIAVPLCQINTIITDSKLSLDGQNTLSKSGCELLIAPDEDDN